MHYYAELYGKLKGYKIIEPVLDKDDDSFWGLLCENEDGQRILAWIYSDEEGNGPGYLELTDVNERLAK